MTNYAYLRAEGREWCKALNRGDKPSDQSWWQCQRVVDHAGHHMSIGEDGTLNSEWIGDGIDSTVDSEDTDDMTDTKHSKDYQVAIDDMVHRVGVKKAYQWLAALADPETAAEAIMEYVRAERDPRTPEAPAPAPFIPGLGNIFGGPNSPTYR